MRDDIKEYNAVETVARKFCEAVKAGKSEIIKPYFYEKASFFGQLNETTYQSGSIEEFYTTIDTFGACGDDYIAILISIYRQKANELNIKFNTNFWTPRKIDMILWANR